MINEETMKILKEHEELARRVKEVFSFKPADIIEALGPST